MGIVIYVVFVSNSNWIDSFFTFILDFWCRCIIRFVSVLECCNLFSDLSIGANVVESVSFSGFCHCYSNQCCSELLYVMNRQSVSFWDIRLQYMCCFFIAKINISAPWDLLSVRMLVMHTRTQVCIFFTKRLKMCTALLSNVSY